MLTKDNKVMEHIPEGSRSIYSLEKWQYFLDAPFEIGNYCCNIMKKNIVHSYTRKTGRYQMTAQMASESRLRTQAWVQNGCNAFNATHPVSNPMAFWFDNDVLLYIKQHNLQIASVYGDIVCENCSDEEIQKYVDTGVFDLGRPRLSTTGCNRTGCMFCGFGCHLDKRPNRFELIDRLSNPNIRDFVMRGGHFDESGLWRPSNAGLGYWFVMKWINVHGGYDMYIPEYDRYEREYGNELTAKYLGVDTT